MFRIPGKVKARITNSLKKYQPVIQSGATRDVNETDTVTIVKDFFADCFGYDKYSELTSEFAIRGTFCDLAVRIDGDVKLLIEVKAPGVSLKDQQIKQAVDYASNSGIEWVILTNSVEWKLFKLEFKQPIESHLVTEFNILNLNHKKDDTAQCLYIFSKEGMTKSVLEDFYGHHKATSRYLLGAMVLSEPVLNTIRRELKRVNKDVKIENTELTSLLRNEVLKRDIIESNTLKDAQKTVKKSLNKAIRTKRPKRKSEKATTLSEVAPVAPNASNENKKSEDAA